MLLLMAGSSLVLVSVSLRNPWRGYPGGQMTTRPPLLSFVRVLVGSNDKSRHTVLYHFRLLCLGHTRRVHSRV